MPTTYQVIYRKRVQLETDDIEQARQTLSRIRGQRKQCAAYIQTINQTTEEPTDPTTDPRENYYLFTPTGKRTRRLISVTASRAEALRRLRAEDYEAYIQYSAGAIKLFTSNENRV